MCSDFLFCIEIGLYYGTLAFIVLYQINVICLVQVRLGNRTYRQKKDKFR